MEAQSRNDPNAIGCTEIIVPLALSFLCGIGGFVWGLVRLAQGHKKPGWVAIGINAAATTLGIVVFVVIAGAGYAGARNAALEVRNYEGAQPSPPTLPRTPSQDLGKLHAAMFEKDRLEVCASVSLHGDWPDGGVEGLETADQMLEKLRQDLIADAKRQRGRDAVPLDRSCAQQFPGRPIFANCRFSRTRNGLMRRLSFGYYDAATVEESDVEMRDCLAGKGEWIPANRGSSE